MFEIRMRAFVGASAGLLVLQSGCAAPFNGMPTAQEIATKPARSGLKDAHFTMSGEVVSGAADVQVKGEGLMVFKPASALRMVLTGSVGVLPLSVELISVGGNDYERVGNNEWTRATSKAKPASGDSWATAKDLKLIREESLSLGKAWHLKGTTNGQPFELWVRESDGYPLKYMNGDPNASLTLTFDRFNTARS